MKALLLTDYRRLEVVDMPPPDVGDDDVLVRVAACGICGSDVHGYDGSSGRRVPPLVMGHEAAGVVEAIGRRVTRFAPGDRVTFDSTISCGDCESCRAGEINLCERRQVLGVSCPEYRRHGAFAEFVAVPERIVYGLPAGLSLEHAALIEPVSVAVHAVRRSSFDSSDITAVFGAGMIGLLVIQVLRDAGCRRIFAVDIDAGRLELARTLGATDAIDATRADAAAEILAATGGRGVDAAFEVVGATGTVAAAVNSVRKGGAVTIIGNISPTVELPLQAVVTREITLRGACASSGEYPECLELLARGAVDVRPLISACVSLDEAPQWFERLYAREPGLMKVVVQPG